MSALKDDLNVACEGARDHGKDDSIVRVHRPPSIARLQRWLVRILRELPDDSVTVREILEALE